MLSKEDIKLLQVLVDTQSSSDDDKDINEKILEIVGKIPGIEVTTDKYGNILASKGEGKSGYKAIVSHTDTVHDIEKVRKSYLFEDILFTMKKVEPFYDSASSISMTGTGGDDRCGVFTCIKALSDFDDIKAVFYRFEETGCRGSNAFDIEYLKNCNFVIQCDRKGKGDFITHTNGIQIASEEFKTAMSPIYTKYKYSPAIGTSTDVGALKRKGLDISCVNLSSGYYSPHSNSETINLTDLSNCYDLVKDMFTQHGNTKFEHKYVPIVHSYSPNKAYKLPQFKYGLDDNFFTKRIQDNFIYIDGGENASLINIPGTDRHKLLINEYTFLPAHVVCPNCTNEAKDNSIMYYSDIAAFYCNNASHADFTEANELYRHCIIYDTKGEYVYNRIEDSWYKKELMVWDKKLETYQKKK